MRNIASLFLGLVTYVILTTMLFGGPFHGLFLLISRSDHLGITGWVVQVIVIVCVLAWMFYGPMARYVQPPFRLSAFIAAAILVPTTYLVLVADWKRTRIIAEFEADYVEQNSLLTSLRRVPADFQFFVHATALKNCQPYAWSYRMMELYPISPDVSVNVIPQTWVKMCGITRD